MRLLILALCLGLAPRDESWVNPPDKEWPGVRHRTFRSASMKRDVGYNIYLPPGYEGTETRFPAAYYLHGMTDCESTHLELMGILHDAIKAGKIEPMILVYTMGGRTGWFTDAADGSVMSETLIIKELIPHVDATTRTIAAREGRALQGWSMGGFGALKFGFKHPEMFSSVVSYGGGFVKVDRFQGRMADLMKRTFGTPEGFLKNAPRHWARTNAEKIRGKLPLRLCVGTKDRLYGVNQAMRAFLDTVDFKHEYEEVEGVGHNPKKVFAAVGLKSLQFTRRHFGKK